MYRSIQARKLKIKFVDFSEKYKKSKEDIDKYYVQYVIDKSFNVKKANNVSEIRNFINTLSAVSIEKCVDIIKQQREKYSSIKDEDIKLLESIYIEIKSIDNQIQMLGESSNITKNLLMLVENKQAFIDFKNEGNDNCPLCGSSENFKDTNKLCAEAEEYLKANKEQELILSTNKQEKIEQFKNNVSELIIKPLNQQKEIIEREVKFNDEIFCENKDLIEYLEKKKCECSDIDKTLNEELNLCDIYLLDDEKYKKISAELDAIYDAQKLDKSQLDDKIQLFQMLEKEEAPVEYEKLDIDIIIKKFLCLEMQQKNARKIELNNQLDLLERKVAFYNKLKNKEFDNAILLNEFKQTLKGAKEIKAKANAKLLDLTKEEVKEVSEMVNYIFQKLMKNNNIGDIKLELLGRINGKSEIKDDTETNVLNTLSQGQMSVLMISYFIANLTIRKDKNIPIYLFDDITQSMDDLNVNSFIDIFKYMLSSTEDRLISQLFITTHDKKLIEIFKQKFSSRNLQCYHCLFHAHFLG